MKSLTINAKLDLELKELPIPQPKSDEVRVKIKYFGICGSDLHYYFEGANGAFVVREPLIPGHELSGVVDLDPSGTYAAGGPVTIHPATFGTLEPGIENSPQLWPNGAYLGSASTWPHTQGGASEYVIFRKDMIRPLPKTLDLKIAALAEPLAVSLHAINQANGVRDKKIFVSGSGPIGLLLIGAAKILGASEIVASDLLEGPLERAKSLGATDTVKIGNQEPKLNYYDAVFECSGVAKAVSTSLSVARRGGTVIQVGMLSANEQPILYAPLVSKELTLRGTFRFNDEIEEAIKMLDQNPKLANAITHVFTTENSVAAFEMAKNSAESGKVLIEFNA